MYKFKNKWKKNKKFVFYKKMIDGKMRGGGIMNLENSGNKIV